MDRTTKSVALVTGASSGIGADIADRLLAEGYVVYAGARRTERMAALAERGAVAVSLDVTDEDSMVRAMDGILADHGRIDVLVNAAGYGLYGALEEVPLAAARQQLETNLIGAARLVQLCLPTMRAQRRGHIVNVSSIGGKFALPLGGWYHASKFALEAYSDALRNEVRQFGIAVVVIEPGGIASEWQGIAAGSAAEHSGSGPYGRMVKAFSRIESSKAPPPSIVSAMVVKALRKAKPATRYSGGLGAGPLLFLKHWLTDRMFDRLLMLAFR